MILEEKVKVKECPHIEVCPLNKYSMKCRFNYKNCQAKKFYDRHGTEYREMFIGSRI